MHINSIYYLKARLQAASIHSVRQAAEPGRGLGDAYMYVDMCVV